MAEGLAPRADEESRHGFLVGSIHVLIPRAIRSQYLPGTSVFPVPRATSRLRGLINWRGQAVVVIDATDPVSADLPIIGACNLLLIGPDDDALALLQSGPPQAVHLSNETTGDVDKPKGWLANALTESRVDADRQVWWELDLAAVAQHMHGTQHIEDPASESGDD